MDTYVLNSGSPLLTLLHKDGDFGFFRWDSGDGSFDYMACPMDCVTPQTAFPQS